MPSPLPIDRLKAERFFEEAFANALPTWKLNHRRSIIENETRFNAFVRQSEERRQGMKIAPVIARIATDMADIVRQHRGQRKAAA